MEKKNIQTDFQTDTNKMLTFFYTSFFTSASFIYFTTIRRVCWRMQRNEMFEIISFVR